MTNRIRCSSAEYSRNVFYQLPKFLFNPEFKGMSYGAKILYALLKDRHELSVQNEWVDDKGDFYLIMSRDEMCELLEVSLKTVIKLITEIKQFGLMEEDRIGLGKPNMIYILQVKTSKNYTPRPVKSTGQDLNNFHANNTYVTKTESNNISLKKNKAKKPKEKDTNGSFETDEFYELAIKRSYESIKEDKK